MSQRQDYYRITAGDLFELIIIACRLIPPACLSVRQASSVCEGEAGNARVRVYVCVGEGVRVC